VSDPVARIIDANANRAREGLRVLEEAARFALDDAGLAGRLKDLRHELVAAVRSLGEVRCGRDVERDAGRRITVGPERARADIGAVVDAAGGRVTEALRVLEAYGKIRRPDVAERIQHLRYAAYACHGDLAARLAERGHRRVDWRLCLLLTEDLCVHRPWDAVLAEAVEAGADAVQVREKSMEAGPLLDRVRAARRITAGRAALIVNDRPDVALAAEADGVHLGQRDLPVAAVRAMVGRRLLIGVSTSTMAEAEKALADGADLCGVGPMFRSGTKHKDTIVGPAHLAAYLAWNGLPHLAIGGITPETLPALLEAGVRGIAVSSAICAAEDPARATRTLRTMLDTARADDQTPH